MSVRRPAPALLLAALLSLGPGCARAPERRVAAGGGLDEPPRRLPSPGAASENEASRRRWEILEPGERVPEDLEPGDYAMAVDRTLIYPVQWQRAEKLAETLQPLLESMYGPGVRVTAHPETNHLLIRLPPAGGLEGRSGAGSTPRRLPPGR